MLTFKSVDDLGQLPSSDPPHGIIEKIVRSFVIEGERSGFPYDPAAAGYVIYVQEDDLDSDSQDVWNEQALIETLWEGVHREADYYIAVYCPNNSFGLVFVMPDEDWLGDDLRAVLEDNLVPLTINSTANN
jgi:hypothetical protein